MHLDAHKVRFVLGNTMFVAIACFAVAIAAVIALGAVQHGMGPFMAALASGGWITVLLSGLKFAAVPSAVVMLVLLIRVIRSK